METTDLTCACVFFQVMFTREQWTGSCGKSLLMTASPSSHRWDRIYQNVVRASSVFIQRQLHPSSFTPILSFSHNNGTWCWYYSTSFTQYFGAIKTELLEGTLELMCSVLCFFKYFVFICIIRAINCFEEWTVLTKSISKSLWNDFFHLKICIYLDENW